MSESYHPPLGLLYIGAALEHVGHDVEIIDFCQEINPVKNLKQAIISSDAVGISLYISDYEYVSNITKTIKEIDPTIPIIIGGPGVIFLKKQFLNNMPNADIIVRGEGEKVIIDIARFLEGKKNLSDVPGVYYRENNAIKNGEEVEVIKDLDSLSFPARHLVDKYEYGGIKNQYLFKKGFTAMETSRGCPHNCRFCTRPNNSISGYSFRQRSAENVVKEIIDINDKYGSVIIVDDNFLANKKRAKEIFQKLIDNGSDIDILILGAHVDSEDSELYKKMKKANVKFIGFGLESGNQDVLEYYNKNFTLEQAQRVVKLSRKMGFVTVATFILGAPIETREHIENTVRFAYSLPLDAVFFLPFSYLKGSLLWIDAVKDNKIKEDENVVVVDSTRNLGNFTKDELFKMLKKAERNFYLRPRYIFDQIYMSSYRNTSPLCFLKNGFRFITSL